MTREELKVHCERQVEACEMWARHNGEEPHGKIYEEHKLILELLEQESILDKVRAEIKGMTPTYHNPDWSITDLVPISVVLNVIDKYKGKNEEIWYK